jgi:hypothetical protein
MWANDNDSIGRVHGHQYETLTAQQNPLFLLITTQFSRVTNRSRI